MQNDMLKNNIAPWQEKGRWYHIEFESDGSTWTFNRNNSDELFDNSNFIVEYPQYFKINHPNLISFDWSIIDIKFKFHAPFYGSLSPYTNVYNIYFSGAYNQDVVLGPANGYIGIVDCWLFISQ